MSLLCALLLQQAHEDLWSLGFLLFCYLVMQGNRRAVHLVTKGPSCSYDVSHFCFTAWDPREVFSSWAKLKGGIMERCHRRDNLLTISRNFLALGGAIPAGLAKAQDVKTS